MSKSDSSAKSKQASVDEIKNLVQSFFEKYLTEEYRRYALKLCDELGRKRKVDISRGQKQIWAASIIYVIARLNFLFDSDRDLSVSPDIISDFFQVKKSTVNTKATQIEKACSLALGAEGYCSQDITDTLTLYETSEGFIVPKNMLNGKEFVIEFMDDEESKEFEKLVEDQRERKEKELEKKRERRIEINRQIAEQKKMKKRNKDQLGLFGDA